RHAKSESRRQDSHEAMLISVQVELFEHLTSECASAAAKVAKARARNEIHESMESRAPHLFECVAGPGKAIADGDIPRLECGEELAKVAAVDLVVCRQSQDGIAGRAREPSHERG